MPTTREVSGFTYSDDGKIRTILFIEPRGKDSRRDIDRWRLTLYYSPHYAATHFCDTEAEYDAFLRQFVPHCFADYATFHAWWRASGKVEDFVQRRKGQ